MQHPFNASLGSNRSTCRGQTSKSIVGFLRDSGVKQGSEVSQLALLQSPLVSAKKISNLKRFATRRSLHPPKSDHFFTVLSKQRACHLACTSTGSSSSISKLKHYKQASRLNLETSHALETVCVAAAHVGVEHVLAQVPHGYSTHPHPSTW